MMYQRQRNEGSEFMKRLLVTTAVQGAVLSLSMYCFNRIINGVASHSVRIKGKKVKLKPSEYALIECVISAEDITTTFDEVGGLDSVKDVVEKSVVAPFHHPELYPAGSLRCPPKGILLHGPPGTGKTMLAKAIAHSCGASFVEVRVENLFGKWLGESEQAVAAIFTLARKIEPCIIFIDEIDSLLRNRSSGDGAAYANAKTIFLRHWDGFGTDEASHRVVVIGATNCPSVLDPAVLRRLPVKINIPYPSCEAREDILRILLRDEDIAGVDLPRIARLTEKYSGSDLKELCKQACLAQVMALLKERKGREVVPGTAKPSPSFFPSLSFLNPQGSPPPPRPPLHLTTQVFLDAMKVVKSNEIFSAQTLDHDPRLDHDLKRGVEHLLSMSRRPTYPSPPPGPSDEDPSRSSTPSLRGETDPLD